MGNIRRIVFVIQFMLLKAHLLAGENKINLGLQILKSEWAEDYQVVSIGFFSLEYKNIC